jgi:serine/threonine-protein kinase
MAGAAGAAAATGAQTQVMGAQGPPTGQPQQQQPKRSALPWILVILLLLVSAAVGYVVYQQLTGGDGVTVPDVRGYTQQQAQTQLQAKGFTTTVEQKASKKVNKGTVIDTDPPHGSTADKGSQVTIIVSTGPKSVNLPNLRGKTLTEAQSAIAGLNLPPPHVNLIASKLPANTVTRTDPKAGPVPPDQVVTLYVSNGNVSVPDVTGLTCSSATTKLADSNLKASCTDTPSDTVPKGQVISQSPSAGVQAQQGSTVSLQVSTGPSQVQVPDVSNDDWPTAQQALKAQGLKPHRVRCLPSDPTTPDGLVVGTDPPAGSMVDKGTDVNVYVANATATTACPA